MYQYGGSQTYVAELPRNKHMHRIHLQKCLNMFEDVVSYRNIYIYIYIYIYLFTWLTALVCLGLLCEFFSITLRFTHTR
jgi:hypothetical protein